jgi:hypothetical protein
MKNLCINLKNDEADLRCDEEEIELSSKKISESESVKMGPTNDSSELSSPSNTSLELKSSEKVEQIIINN